MQGHFCFIKSPIFAFLPDIDMSATCWMFDEACSCGPYFHVLCSDITQMEVTQFLVTAEGNSYFKCHYSIILNRTMKILRMNRILELSLNNFCLKHFVPSITIS